MQTVVQINNFKRSICQQTTVWIIVKVAGNIFEKCEKNGFEHDIVEYYRVLKGIEHHSVMQK